MAYDVIVIGAGLYGLYAARHCGRRGQRVMVLEADGGPFSRATTINQARVHMGYHYPRSLSTARRSAGYFSRFVGEFAGCIKRDFTQVYATSSHYSWTAAPQFKKFCRDADIRCDAADPEAYFNPGLCDGAFLTTEYTYDALLLCKQLLADLAVLPGVQVRYDSPVTAIAQKGRAWAVSTARGEVETAPMVVNATYASVNGINALAGFEPFDIKYELCEMILCKAGGKLKDVGITVMDGPFFSIMPFGQTGLHSLTSVTFTPHLSGGQALPAFSCQGKTDGGGRGLARGLGVAEPEPAASDAGAATRGGACAPGRLANCNECPRRPQSAWPSVSQLARKYLREEYGFTYHASLYSVKPILKASEVDDSRPTLVRVQSEEPRFISVLSGKINTVYDMEEVL